MAFRLIRHRVLLNASWMALTLVITNANLAVAQPLDRLSLTSPRPCEVVQRTGYNPEEAHSHAAGGPKWGEGKLLVSGTLAGGPDAKFQFRAVVQDSSRKLLAPQIVSEIPWTEFTPARDGDKFRGTITLPAGGWYRLDVQAFTAGEVAGSATVEPVGIGEVFIVAGQSYAAGANDELLKVTDPAGRVSRWDFGKQIWEIAHDPQPHVDTGGTIWPAFGDELLPFTQVPIGIINVASGGTSSRQWLPETPLYERLKTQGKLAGRFRAVLWQQGESDVIEKVTTEKFVENLTLIRESLAREWEFSPPWLLAKSTLHPTVYNDSAGEGRIRAAITLLAKQPGFVRGPDTDILDGENRGGPMSRRHFTGIGQRRAAKMWFVSVWNLLENSASEIK